MLLFSYITWDPSPEIFSIGDFSLRYYGLSYTLAFILGYYLVEKMFKFDNLPPHWVYRSFFYVLMGVVIGGRLGHVIFYDQQYYVQHPTEIFMIWRGGMASHGAGFGVIVALLLFSWRVTKQSPLWFLDYAAMPVCSGAVFIRLGNLMNSEIVGTTTDLPWGFCFLSAQTVNDPLTPRHPAQLYEALIYLITFLILLYMFFRTDARKRLGLLLGVSLIGLFGMRFFVEFVKENQVPFEEGMLLNMGQILSIPLGLWGVYLIIRGCKKPPVEMTVPEAERLREE